MVHPSAVPTPLTVVMPAYNEEDSIVGAVEEVCRCVLDLVPGSDLVVVDDGSRDRTGAILDDLAAAEPRLSVLHQANAGHGPAVGAGMDRASGEWLFLVDSDRQIPLDGFAGAWERRPGMDAVLGRRTNRKETIVRRVITATLRGSLWIGLGVVLEDANVPFKLVRREVWIESRPLIGADCLIPSVFLAACLYRQGRPYLVIPVAHRPRAAGKASLRSLRLLGFCMRGMGQLLGLRAALRRTWPVRPAPGPAAVPGKL